MKSKVHLADGLFMPELMIAYDRASVAELQKGEAQYAA